MRIKERRIQISELGGMDMSVSLFEKYGGFATVSKLVSELYDELAKNEVTAPYFERSNMTALMDHQVKFLSQALGGKYLFTGLFSCSGMRSKPPLCSTICDTSEFGSEKSPK